MQETILVIVLSIASLHVFAGVAAAQTSIPSIAQNVPLSGISGTGASVVQVRHLSRKFQARLNNIGWPSLEA
jgi:hypothetical protein